MRLLAPAVTARVHRPPRTHQDKARTVGRQPLCNGLAHGTCVWANLSTRCTRWMRVKRARCALVGSVMSATRGRRRSAAGSACAIALV